MADYTSSGIFDNTIFGNIKLVLDETKIGNDEFLINCVYMRHYAMELENISSRIKVFSDILYNEKNHDPDINKLVDKLNNSIDDDLLFVAFRISDLENVLVNLKSVMKIDANTLTSYKMFDDTTMFSDIKFIVNDTLYDKYEEYMKYNSYRITCASLRHKAMKLENRASRIKVFTDMLYNEKERDFQKNDLAQMLFNSIETEIMALRKNRKKMGKKFGQLKYVTSLIYINSYK